MACGCGTATGFSLVPANPNLNPRPEQSMELAREHGHWWLAGRGRPAVERPDVF